MQKLRIFLASDYFNLIMLLIAAVIIMVDQLVASPVYYGFSVIFGFIICAVLLLTDDIVSILGPSLILISFLIQYKNSYDGYMHYLWAIPIIAFCIIFHFVYYRKAFSFKKPSELELIRPMCAAAVALILGGVGIMSFSEYTTKINLSYMFCLGPLVILVYWFLSGLIGPGKNYTEHMDERLSKIMVAVAGFLIFAIFEYYGEHWQKFLADPDILPFQWRNNACTLLMLAMPFSFYMARKKHFAYIIVPLMSCVAFVLSGSRGGLVFGAIEFLILIVYYAKVDKKHRKFYIAILSLLIVAAIIFVILFSDMLAYTIDRFTSYKENFRRLGLWKRSITDFLANPITGRGIGYMGNRDLHPSAIGQLCWYHSSIPQVIGSFGIVGIICYGYQLLKRLSFFKKRRDDAFSVTIFFSFLALELMSLVNPGIFAPAYLVIITMFFIFAEQYYTKME